MDDQARDAIRRIFFNRRPHVALLNAATWLGMSMKALRGDIADGAIVAVETGVGLRIPREEMLALAMRVWPQAVIDAALGDGAAGVLPEASRRVVRRARET